MRLDGPVEIQAMRKKLIGYCNLICKCPQAQIDGYSFISKPRKSAKGGGVGAYISSSVPYHRRLNLELDDIECLWIEVLFPKSKGFLIGFIYRLFIETSFQKFHLQIGINAYEHLFGEQRMHFNRGHEL